MSKVLDPTAPPSCSSCKTVIPDPAERWPSATAGTVCQECWEAQTARLWHAMVLMLPEDGGGRLDHKELVDRLGWIAAQLTDIEWLDDVLVVSQAAALIKRWQLSLEQQDLPADPADPAS